jgi:hypothetical protein
VASSEAAPPLSLRGLRAQISVTDDSRLTICTVSYGHAQHLALNRCLAARLNGSEFADIEWLVAENAPADTPRRLSGKEKHFKHYDGASYTALGSSHQHALALGQLLTHVTTRFVLILDPDFYILRPDWASEVLQYMQQRNLAFFGAPWHPRYVDNYRYFPAVHCMFVDTSLIRIEHLDFRPLLGDDSNSHSANDRGFASTLWKTICFERRRRGPWDTGTRVFNRFAGNPNIRAECVVPVYRVRKDWLGQGNPLRLTNRLLELILPDEKCYLPKRRESYTQKTFSDRGWNIPELPALWEQHVWKEQPFGLHIGRSFSGGTRDEAAELAKCRSTVAVLCPSISKNANPLQ